MTEQQWDALYGLLWACTMGHAVILGLLLGILWRAVR